MNLQELLSSQPHGRELVGDDGELLDKDIEELLDELWLSDDPETISQLAGLRELSASYIQKSHEKELKADRIWRRMLPLGIATTFISPALLAATSQYPQTEKTLLFGFLGGLLFYYSGRKAVMTHLEINALRKWLTQLENKMYNLSQPAELDLLRASNFSLENVTRHLTTLETEVKLSELSDESLDFVEPGVIDRIRQRILQELEVDKN